MLGIGGGSAISPLLLLAGGLKPAQIAGTTLATVLLISAVGSGAYASLGFLNLGLAWPIAMGSATAAVFGAMASRRLSMRLMISMFILILPYFAAKELWPSFAAPELSTNFVSLVILGSATGFVSGLLGISGASLVVPSLVAFFLLDHHAAQGIAISVALADSIAGTATHAKQGNIDYSVLRRLAGPAIAAALIGSFLSSVLPAIVLRHLFAAFMLATWGMLVARLVRDYIEGKAVSSPGHHQDYVFATLHPPPRAGNGIWVAKRYREAVSGYFTGKGIPSIGTAMGVMLIFIPLTIAGKSLDAPPVFIFTFAALACVALSYRLGHATEALGSRLGPIAGGLLNATFGNAAEVVISLMALHQGLFVVVRTGLVGSILGQLLLVLGTSLLLAGLKYRKLGFSRDLVQINFTLMVLALVAIGLPSVLLATNQASAGLLTPVLCALLAVIDVVAVIFSLQRQPEEHDDGQGKNWTPAIALLVLVACTGGIVLISEYLVGSIVPFVESTGVSQVFVGLILIPIFSNVVDHIVAISVALKNRMDLSLTISIGSASQIACLVLPAIVIIGYTMGHSSELVFTPIELVSLGAGLLLMVPVLLDGESNWLEGAQLLTCYLILGVILWNF